VEVVMRAPVLVLAVLVLASSPAAAEGIDRGTNIVVLGTIDAVRAVELPPCPEDAAEEDEAAGPTRCGSILVAEVRPQEFLRGSRRERLTVRFPRRAEDPELAGLQAALFLERHGDELWVAGGRAGLVTARDPFPPAAVDRLRLALALEPLTARQEDTHDPAPDAPRVPSPADGVSLPVVTKKTRPEYPEVARRAHAQGKVLLSAVIGTDGRVSDLRVLKSAYPGWGLEIAALRAVAQWEYEPAREDGTPVAVYLTVGVDFTLDGAPAELPDQELEPGPFTPGAHAVAEALAALAPLALEVPEPEPTLLESEERSLRWAFARFVKAKKEKDGAAFARLLHPEFLESFREVMLRWIERDEAGEALQQVFGTADRATLQALGAKEMWMRMQARSMESDLFLSAPKTEEIYLGAVAEGEDLRHVTVRTKARGFLGLTTLTFKRDGSDWKLFPEERFGDFEADEPEEDE
jgi:TonB family protein